MNNATIKNCLIGTAMLLMAGLCGCHKFLSTPSPTQVIASNQVWGNDSATAAFLDGTLGELAGKDIFDGAQGISVNFAAYGDELTPVADNSLTIPVYVCAIPVDFSYAQIYWDECYKEIYNMNLLIEGAAGSRSLIHQHQWLGEAYFLRAFLYFYLTNIFGDVPLALSTDYTVNNSLSRSSQSMVFQQIVNDLKNAIGDLDDVYHDGQGNMTSDHGRPNRAAAELLLARVYLYQGDWSDAETAAGVVIDDPQYTLVSPKQTFLANSAESIWQLAPNSRGVDDYKALDAAPGMSFVLSDSLIAAIGPGDERRQWVDSVSSMTIPAKTWYLAAKYDNYTPGVDYIMICRLAEAYMIRAEARANRGNISGGLSDLNVLRQRAQPQPLLLSDQAALLSAIARENRIEFFCEEGHRFFDLRRTGELDAVETTGQAVKGSSWQTYKQYWPIPSADILSDPHLAQTPGY